MSVLHDVTNLHLPDIFAYPTPVAPEEMTLPLFKSRRADILALLAREEYGEIPSLACSVSYQVGENRRFGGGSAEFYAVTVTVSTEKGSHSFPLYCVIPVENRPCPAFLHINFRDPVPDAYMPSEEISDNGFACFSFCYNDVTRDNADFTDGLAGLLYPDGKRAPADPGKISLWAWAAMRAMDYIQTLDCIDHKNIGVVGHSRLGKTALWTAANDERFSFCFANESGCGGAALARGVAEEAEHLHDLCKNFPYWFCERYQAYAGRESEMPFDQHFLLSLLAPRRLYVSSADADLWTGPASQYQACQAASRVWELYGKYPSFTGPDDYPVAGEAFHEGYIGYHMRSGDHFLSRRDWLQFMAYMKKHLNK